MKQKIAPKRRQNNTVRISAIQPTVEDTEQPRHTVPWFKSEVTKVMLYSVVVLLTLRTAIFEAQQSVKVVFVRGVQGESAYCGSLETHKFAIRDGSMDVKLKVEQYIQAKNQILP